MSEARPNETSGHELKEILSGLHEWRRQHPKATLAEIERETMKRMAALQARLIEELSQELPVDEDEIECPECGHRMYRRGKRERQLQGPGEQTLSLKRTFWVCPACGAGIFPPG
jgi:YgiT-type zinc finger domain-containing protein